MRKFLLNPSEDLPDLQVLLSGTEAVLINNL
jgi:hypothetical protein